MLWRNFRLFYQQGDFFFFRWTEKYRCFEGYKYGNSATFSVRPCLIKPSPLVQIRSFSFESDPHNRNEIIRKQPGSSIKFTVSSVFHTHNQSCRFSRCQHRLAQQQPTNDTKRPTDSNDSKKTNEPSPLPEDGKKKTKATNYFVIKFQKFIDGYQSILEKKFPGAMNVYRVFVVGFKEFSKEFAQYVRIRAKVIIHPGRIHNFSRKELELYYRMPSEIFKVGPTLLISALPFANYVVFPIAYYFPKRLLSSHFWSIQQKSQFAIEYQRERYHYYRPVFRQLQQYIELVEDEELRKMCLNIFSKLGSGVHPTSREIIQIQSLFYSHPFSLKAIYGPHVKKLCRMYGIHTMYFSRSRLYDHAEMLCDLDVAIIREGISNLKTDDLRSVCFMRGLNASNTSHQDMLDYLTQWIKISSKTQPDGYSLLLHLPIFLGYNNPNNWALKM